VREIRGRHVGDQPAEDFDGRVEGACCRHFIVELSRNAEGRLQPQESGNSGITLIGLCEANSRHILERNQSGHSHRSRIEGNYRCLLFQAARVFYLSTYLGPSLCTESNSADRI
jgi:hypothetical protein